jgi:hypothetical protein
VNHVDPTGLQFDLVGLQIAVSIQSILVGIPGSTPIASGGRQQSEQVVEERVRKELRALVPRTRTDGIEYGGALAMRAGGSIQVEILAGRTPTEDEAAGGLLGTVDIPQAVLALPPPIYRLLAIFHTHPPPAEPGPFIQNGPFSGRDQLNTILYHVPHYLALSDGRLYVNEYDAFQTAGNQNTGVNDVGVTELNAWRSTRTFFLGYV